MRTEEKIKGNTKTRRKFSNENDFIKKINKCLNIQTISIISRFNNSSQITNCE